MALTDAGSWGYQSGNELCMSDFCTLGVLDIRPIQILTVWQGCRADAVQDRSKFQAIVCWLNQGQSLEMTSSCDLVQDEGCRYVSI